MPSETFILNPGRTSRQGTNRNENKSGAEHVQEASTQLMSSDTHGTGMPNSKSFDVELGEVSNG